MAQVHINYIVNYCVINITMYELLISCTQNCLNVAEPLDPTVVKPMPFQDRVTFSMCGGKPAATAPSKPAASAPSKLVVSQSTKPVTSNMKKGNVVKRPASSRGKPKIKPEENQPKVSQFFKPLVVIADSSSDDFLPDIVAPKNKLYTSKKDFSFSPDYSPKYSYSFIGGPFALSSPARVNPALTSPEMSPVFWSFSK